jgi:hypothetical protein
MVEQNLIRLCIGFFPYSQLGKRGFANLYYKGFLIIFRIQFLGQLKYKALDRSMVWVLLEVAIPLSTTVNVSSQTLMFIYQKLKMNKRVKKEKHHKRHKFKWLFLFDFLWRKH